MSQKLRGLVGQRLGGPKALSGGRVELLGLADAATGSGSIVAPKSCIALIYAWGPGGSGCAGTGSPGGGGGGGALYKRIRLSAGQSIAYALGTKGTSVTDSGSSEAGNNGTDTTLTLPTGAPLIAGGGKGGGNSTPGLGGSSRGGDLNRTGQSGPGNGGAAAGFSDLVASLVGGTGGIAPGGAGNAAGGGGGAHGGGMGSVSGAGANGRVLIILVRTL